MKQLTFIILLFFLLTLASCEYHNLFRFENNSTRDVYIYLGIVNREMGGSLYPDTAVARVKCGELFKQGKIRSYHYGDDKEDPWRNNTFCLFIFDADTFNMYDWEEIKSGYKILQRYDISYENIKALKYNIIYPPDETMNDVKMYPPYEKKTDD